jgi:hypothetical protein
MFIKNFFLEVTSTGFIIPGWAEKISVLAILAGLVYYFSKQLDQMKELREEDRKEFELKREADRKEMVAMHDKAIESINNNTNVMQRLIDKIDNQKN